MRIDQAAHLFKAVPNLVDQEFAQTNSDGNTTDHGEHTEKDRKELIDGVPQGGQVNIQRHAITSFLS